MIIKKGNFFKPYDKNFNFKNRQNLEDVFLRSGSMYFFNVKNLKKMTQSLDQKFLDMR